jgi:hypothetical protein
MQATSKTAKIDCVQNAQVTASFHAAASSFAGLLSLQSKDQ